MRKKAGTTSTKHSKSLWAELIGLRRLWPFLRPYKKFVMPAIVLIPFISLIEMNIPLVIKNVVDHGISEGSWAYVIKGSAFYLGLVLLQYLGRSCQSILSAIGIHRMVRRLRRHLIRHILYLPCSFHDKALSGRLVTRATSDFDALSDSLNMGVLTSVIDIAVLIGAFVGLFYLDYRLAFCALLMLPAVGLVIQVFSQTLKNAMLLARQKIAALNAFNQEALYSLSTIKLLHAEDDVQKRFDDLNEEYRKAQMKSVILDALMFAIVDGLASITVGLILYYALVSIGVQQISAGVIVAFVQYIQQIFEPLKQLSNKIAMLQGTFTSLERIFSLLDEKTPQLSGEHFIIKKGKVSFHHVSYAYDQKHLVLKDVHFVINPGDSVALVGPTGSGKSTIIKLLTRLYDGYTGQIFIDDFDIQKINPQVLRQQIAIVPQDIALFDGTIRFNMTLGQENISEEQLIEASRRVGAHAFIKQLPQAYDFELQEQGSNLSFGQRQLIAFARALVKNPKLIILDEATSSIDPESEKLIQDGMLALAKGRTMIIIAHRPATIQHCNRILYCQNGQVKELSSTELARYRRIKAQSNDFILQT